MAGFARKPRRKTPGRATGFLRPSFANERPVEGETRLQKLISEAGLCSRRGAERLIAEGRVSVNGQVVDHQGVKVNSAHDQVSVDGQLVGQAQDFHYYMFYKPVGCLTTLDDPRERPTIEPYLDNLPVRVFPVGRLDMDVEGLLILTNDGPLAKKLMHPSSHVPKVYRIKVAGVPDERVLEKLRDGRLMIGDRPAAPAEAELIKTGEDRGWILLTIIEGRKHQVKRMCSAVGHPVLKLKRVAYGGLTLGLLRRGEMRRLTRTEVEILKTGRVDEAVRVVYKSKKRAGAKYGTKPHSSRH